MEENLNCGCNRGGDNDTERRCFERTERSRNCGCGCGCGCQERNPRACEPGYEYVRGCDGSGCFRRSDRDPFWPSFSHPQWLSLESLYCPERWSQCQCRNCGCGCNTLRCL